MTLNAKDLLATPDQFIFESGTVRVVTSDTGHHLNIPGIPYLLTYRMAEFTLCFMALSTDHVAVFLQHCRSVAAVHGMAFVTVFIDFRMDVCFIAIAPKGVFVTTATHLALFGPQQTDGIAGMGTVAVSAAVTGGGCCMIMDTVCRFPLLGMTAYTGIGSNRAVAFFVTIIATGSKRFMQKVADHALSITAMRIVARQTLLDCQRIIFVHLFDLLTGMTGNTDFLRTADQ